MSCAVMVVMFTGAVSILAAKRVAVTTVAGAVVVASVARTVELIVLLIVPVKIKPLTVSNRFMGTVLKIERFETVKVLLSKNNFARARAFY